MRAGNGTHEIRDWVVAHAAAGCNEIIKTVCSLISEPRPFGQAVYDAVLLNHPARIGCLNVFSAVLLTEELFASGKGFVERFNERVVGIFVCKACRLRADFWGRMNLSPEAATNERIRKLKPRRTTMSRKVILSLATAATIITAGLASNAADARGFGGGGFGGGHSFGGGAHFASGGHVGGSHFAGRGGRGGRIATARNPGRGGHPGHGHPNHWAHNGHHHWMFRDGVWIDADGAVDETPDVAPVAAAPGPCTCLTKSYTPAGLVVFADVCTKEAASARVDGNTSDATQAPTSSNYAGRTYKDFLAANTQAASDQKN
jgi:hypothetical protein